MRSYARIETAEQLPGPGTQTALLRERSDLDFKSFVEPKNMVEHAKDIAAFANALGGRTTDRCE